MLDTSPILEQFDTSFGAQMEAVFDVVGVDCLFGSNFGVLKSVKFEVRRRQMPCLAFFKISAVKDDYCVGITSCSYFDLSA